MTRREFTSLSLGLALTGCNRTPAPEAPTPSRFEFTRMTVHWQDYVRPDYLPFLRDTRPEVVQVGFYGADFYTLAHMPDSAKGLSGPLMPSHAGVFEATAPADRLRRSAEYFENLNGEIKKLGAKVIGHFDIVKYLLGDKSKDPAKPEGGFFEYYNNLWDEKELGPKPVADPLDLLQQNPRGVPIMHTDEDAKPYGVYFGCLNNPHWRAVLKAWVKRGIERGLDGYVINYFYRHNCVCQHCERAFKAFLKARFTPAQLREQFEIADLDSHVFTEIMARHNPKQSTPLRLEMHRFSDISNKQNFDDVFVDYGRGLKPDLILAKWLHLYDFRYPPHGPTDERQLLPAELWARDEDYLWYCVGGVRKPTGLAKGILGDGTLAMRYIRGAADDKPFTICQYERTRVRAIFSEVAANGGCAMSNYTEFFDAASRAELVRYYGFMRRYDALFHANRSHAEVLLVFPRREIHRGRYHEAMEPFHKIALELMNRHLLFDVLPDDIVTEERKRAYKRVFTTADTVPQDLTELSVFDLPHTVRVAANRPAGGNEIDLHFVNYNRDESQDPPKRGVEDERPIAVPQVRCDVVIPDGFRASKVEMITPEDPEPVTIAVETAGNRAHFTVPQFLVYGLARIHLEAGNAPGGQRAARLQPQAKVLPESAQGTTAPFEPFDHAECSRAF
ncbi:MAG: hypothetical protein IPM24_04075 [Bryobacterales bacterium]|nr:hypothetical protein [Bryobacterales bacterium]